jgi:hypothetical protein
VLEESQATLAAHFGTFERRPDLAPEVQNQTPSMSATTTGTDAKWRGGDYGFHVCHDVEVLEVPSMNKGLFAKRYYYPGDVIMIEAPTEAFNEFSDDVNNVQCDEPNRFRLPFQSPTARDQLLVYPGSFAVPSTSALVRPTAPRCDSCLAPLLTARGTNAHALLYNICLKSRNSITNRPIVPPLTNKQVAPELPLEHRPAPSALLHAIPDGPKGPNAYSAASVERLHAAGKRLADVYRGTGQLPEQDQADSDDEPDINAGPASNLARLVAECNDSLHTQPSFTSTGVPIQGPYTFSAHSGDTRPRLPTAATAVETGVLFAPQSLLAAQTYGGPFAVARASRNNDSSGPRAGLPMPADILYGDAELGIRNESVPVRRPDRHPTLGPRANKILALIQKDQQSRIGYLPARNIKRNGHDEAIPLAGDFAALWPHATEDDAAAAAAAAAATAAAAAAGAATPVAAAAAAPEDAESAADSPGADAAGTDPTGAGGAEKSDSAAITGAAAGGDAAEARGRVLLESRLRTRYLGGPQSVPTPSAPAAFHAAGPLYCSASCREEALRRDTALLLSVGGPRPMDVDKELLDIAKTFEACCSRVPLTAHETDLTLPACHFDTTVNVSEGVLSGVGPRFGVSNTTIPFSQSCPLTGRALRLYAVLLMRAFRARGGRATPERPWWHGMTVQEFFAGLRHTPAPAGSFLKRIRDVQEHLGWNHSRNQPLPKAKHSVNSMSVVGALEVATHMLSQRYTKCIAALVNMAKFAWPGADAAAELATIIGPGASVVPSGVVPPDAGVVPPDAGTGTGTDAGAGDFKNGLVLPHVFDLVMEAVYGSGLVLTPGSAAALEAQHREAARLSRDKTLLIPQGDPSAAPMATLAAIEVGVEPGHQSALLQHLTNTEQDMTGCQDAITQGKIWGLYPWMAKVNHSCRPNAVVSGGSALLARPPHEDKPLPWATTICAVLTCQRAIIPGEEITVNYVPEFLQAAVTPALLARTRNVWRHEQRRDFDDLRAMQAAQAAEQAAAQTAEQAASATAAAPIGRKGKRKKGGAAVYPAEISHQADEPEEEGNDWRYPRLRQLLALNHFFVCSCKHCTQVLPATQIRSIEGSDDGITNPWSRPSAEFK